MQYSQNLWISASKTQKDGATQIQVTNATFADSNHTCSRKAKASELEFDTEVQTVAVAEHIFIALKLDIQFSFFPLLAVHPIEIGGRIHTCLPFHKEAQHGIYIKINAQRPYESQHEKTPRTLVFCTIQKIIGHTFIVFIIQEQRCAMTQLPQNCPYTCFHIGIDPDKTRIDILAGLEPDFAAID